MKQTLPMIPQFPHLVGDPVPALNSSCKKNGGNDGKKERGMALCRLGAKLYQSSLHWV